MPLSSLPVRCAPKGCPGQPGQVRAGLAGSSCPGPPMLGGEAEPDPRKPTGKAKRRWDGRAEISAMEKDGRRGLGMRAGERGGARPGKAAMAAREGRSERGSWEPAKPFPVSVRHLARPLTGWGGSLRIMDAVVRDWGALGKSNSSLPCGPSTRRPSGRVCRIPLGRKESPFPPEEPPRNPSLLPPRGSAKVFCSFQELKAV